MKPSSSLVTVLFALTVVVVVRANDQQTQQAAMNAAVCLLAIRAGSSSARRPDLQDRADETGSSHWERHSSLQRTY
jgi:hypothetical protein